jgi:nucleotide-binding universal stress UspA family protein
MGRIAAAVASRRVVVGVAGSAASAAAVTWAAREAELRGAVLHAVHAWEPAGRGRAPYAPSPYRRDRDDEQAAAALLRTVVQEGLGTAAPGLASSLPGTAEPLLEVAEGLAVQVLLDSAAGAELLVLGGSQPAGDAGGRPSAGLGPVARACLRAAPCPVVTVSPQHIRQPRQRTFRSLVAALS